MSFLQVCQLLICHYWLGYLNRLSSLVVQTPAYYPFLCHSLQRSLSMMVAHLEHRDVGEAYSDFLKSPPSVNPVGWRSDEHAHRYSGLPRERLPSIGTHSSLFFSSICHLFFLPCNWFICVSLSMHVLLEAEDGLSFVDLNCSFQRDVASTMDWSAATEKLRLLLWG